MRSPIAAIVLSSFTMFLAACSSETASSPRVSSEAPDTPDPVQTSDDAAKQFEWVGKYHNDALDHAFAKLRASKTSSKLDQCRVGIAALKEFQKAYRKPDGSPVSLDSKITDGMCELAAKNNFAVPSSSASLITQGKISPTASGFMNEIGTAVDNTDGLPAYTFAVNRIMNNAEAALGSGSLETNAVFATGSVGVSSEQYWIANESSWSSGPSLPTVVLSSPGTAPQYQVGARTRAIIRADVSAAISVLVVDWWQGELAIEKAMFKAAAASLIAGLSLLF